MKLVPFQLHLSYTICIELIFKKRDFWHFEKIHVYFVRASLWVPYWTNLGLIKGEPLWRLPLTYLLSLEVASSDSLTCSKRSAPNKDHIIWYQSFDFWYRFYPIRYFFPSYLVVFVLVVFHSCCFCSCFRSCFCSRFHFLSILFDFVSLSACYGWSVCALLYSNTIRNEFCLLDEFRV